MAVRHYTASKARDKGRERYSVIFRHPALLDRATGKPGRRVRRGLGTSDPVVADRVVADINELLANNEYWSVTARPGAISRFDARAVSAFFDGMDPASIIPSSVLRSKFLPLPSVKQGYRRVLMLGTTGAGKTTVVRQLLGTDPKEDRFPSTSTAKTTVADTEIVIADGPFRAIVTFYARDEVVDHLVDCASKAALAALRTADDEEVGRLLLDHEDQRFRFSYVLGRKRVGASTANESSGNVFDDFDDFDAPESSDDDFDAEPRGLAGIDLNVTATVVDTAIGTLRTLVDEHKGEAHALLEVVGQDDERIARELLDEQLDKILRGDERFNALVDSLLEEIEKRFDALAPGTVTRDQQSWPSTWSWETEDRKEFLRAVNRFSSNYAPQFGHLLSPLVNGIRVAGPFMPKWLDGDAPRLVLIDGEGLGHTPRSVASLPTAVAERIQEVDAVLLVDSAASPMQAAPAQAVRSILTGGNTDKLLFCFTHFDEVKGDNLRSGADRARHVLASVENLLSGIRIDFGPRSEGALRRQLERARFFLADIDKNLDSMPNGSQSIAQLKKMLTTIDRITDKTETGPSRPVYDKVNLVFAVRSAAVSFHRHWKALLGLKSEADVDKEHWTRVKALNRRFAEGTSDYYDTLRPASDLRELLKEGIYRTLETPLRWNGGEPADDETTTAVINAFSQAIDSRLYSPILERLSTRPRQLWQEAYSLSGNGSTFERARRISEIFGRNVPVPNAAPSPDQNDFLHAVLATVEDAAKEIEVVLT